MATKKYELLQDDTIQAPDGSKLYRIRALIDIPDRCKVGDIGGYIRSELNLSHKGSAWVFDSARVSGNAQVSGDALVSGNTWVYDNARVYGNAQVRGDARVYDDALVYGNARVSGDARVSGIDALVWFSNVGSENGTLTCYRGKDGDLSVTRGCFSGTDKQFLAAVEEKHGASKISHEYRLLIEVARSRIGIAPETAPVVQG